MISENERYYAEMVLGVIDTVECPMLMCEGEKAIVRKALKAYIESNGTADTPQTESTGSPIGDYRDGVGAWQTEPVGCTKDWSSGCTSCERYFSCDYLSGRHTDCDDRYAVRTDSGEVVAYACPLGCEQTDCGWK